MILSDTLYPFREENYQSDLQSVQERLSSVCRDGCFVGRDQQLIHYRVLYRDKPTAAMILCHDGGESAIRYTEWAAFFYDLGYEVYLFDFRGHGRSERCLSNRSVTHVDSFDEYARDLSDLTSRIKRSIPLSVTAFGMGAVALLLYMQKNPRRLTSACLISPLLSINLPAPVGLYRLKLARAVRKGLSREILIGSSCYQPGEVFSGSGWKSFARFAWYREVRASDSRLQNSAYTVGWLNAALRASDRLFTQRTKRIATRTLLIEAGADRIVPSDAYRRILHLLPNGSHLCLTEAEHRVQNTDGKTMGDLMDLLAAYFQLPNGS